jgi:hypothetical protein
MKVIDAITILLLLRAVGAAAETTNLAEATLTRFNSISGSKVTLKGKYGLRKWQAEGTLICGFLEVEPGFAALRGMPGSVAELSARGEVFVPVRNLKAVGESREEYTEQMTGMLHRMLRAEEHPRIYFWFSRLGASVPQSGEGLAAFTATGKLAIAGVTNEISLPMIVKRLGGGAIQISGKTIIRHSHFGIPMPTNIIIDAADPARVDIAFDWCVKETGAR